MNGVSTLTQKGQVAIPKAIRDHFHLKPADRIYFSIEDDKIVAKPAPRIEDMRGIIHTDKVLTKKEYKKIIRDAVVEKFNRKNT